MTDTDRMMVWLREPRDADWGVTMSTPRCYMQLGACGPAVAWLTTSPAATTLYVCHGQT